LASEIVHSVVRIASRVTYEQADLLIALGGGAPRLDEPNAGFAPPEPPPDAEAQLPPGLGAAAGMFAQAARLARELLERRAVAAVRRQIKRTEIGLTPGPHAGLGVPAYVQVTSPLRRYQDLAGHRQLRAALRGEPLPFDAEALWRVAATCDEAEKTARDVERG